jgi:hypothetical protein
VPPEAVVEALSAITVYRREHQKQTYKTDSHLYSVQCVCLCKDCIDKQIASLEAETLRILVVVGVVCCPRVRK